MAMPTGCDWSSHTTNDWVHIQSGGSGNGNGTVNYALDANAGAPRVGTIAVGGQALTIYQAEPPPFTYAIINGADAALRDILAQAVRWRSLPRFVGCPVTVIADLALI